MKTLQAFSWILVLGCAAALGACDAEQPLPQCTVGRGEHAVRYTLVSGAGTCAAKRAEKLGAQIFRTPGSGEPPSLVFKPGPFAANEGKDPAHSLTSTGNFTTEYPSKDEVCEVPTLSEARQLVARTPGTPVDVRYQWSNVRVQGSAAIPGTQWIADLTYSEDDCTATYVAVGLFPALKCERTEVRDGQNVVVRDPAICALPRPSLSIDPAFPTLCDETTNLCVLDGEPPALLP
ncbi:hypothetical protein POL68_42460 [Stigmatella sp. ncwal1]|uniref:MlpA n=1 Tax=Stigmatella ashevillensis TaxID=2995309 RepID=A0ABT5DR54_9BACT|nr:hypothetical protein [Stigmatella ashevillena]MDC0715188.1 hypothetical protein [Stigmatella ashevillena]